MKGKQLLIAPILAILILVLILPPIFTRADSPPVFITKWGSCGSGDGQFDGPGGVAVDSAGNVYVAELRNNRIQKFDNNGVFLTKWGSLGSGNGQFLNPQFVAVDSANNLYVADSNNARIQKFDSNGTFVTQWFALGPWGVGVDKAGNVYVTEPVVNRVEKFNSNGIFLTRWGFLGNGDGQFDWPRDVDVDSAGNVYVIDGNNNRIQKFDSNGTFLAKWVPGGFGIDLDSADNVYVTRGSIVQKHDSNGIFLTQWGSDGSGDGQFNGSVGVAVDNTGNIYVTDSGNCRIQKFGQLALTLTKTVDNTKPALGEQINYIITVNNSGLISATNALISDTLPISITFAGPVTLHPPQPGAILATSAANLPTLASNVTIPPQSSIVLTLPVTVNVDINTTTTAIINTAAVTSAETSTPATGQVSLGGNNIYLPIIVKN